jgi:hypothetical protein
MLKTIGDVRRATGRSWLSVVARVPFCANLFSTPRKRSYRVLFGLSLSGSILPSVSLADGNCNDLPNHIKDGTSGPHKYFDTFTFQEKGQGNIILILFKDSSVGKVLPKHWLLLNRVNAESMEFCIVGQGEEFGKLMDMHANTYDVRYGLPGSGYPRCAPEETPVGSAVSLPGSMLIRAWANRELGQSTIFYTESVTTSGFQYIMSADNYWVIIEDKKVYPKESCYFSRGVGLLVQQNLRYTGP